MNKNIIIGALLVVVVVLLVIIMQTNTSLQSATAINTQYGTSLSGLSLETQSLLKQMAENPTDTVESVDSSIIDDIKRQPGLKSLTTINDDAVAPPGLYIQCFDIDGGVVGQMEFKLKDDNVYMSSYWGYVTDSCEYKTNI